MAAGAPAPGELRLPDGSAPDLHLSQHPPADALLSRSAFALLLGMLLDQQFPMEKAFAGPHLLAERLGTARLDPASLATVDPQELAVAMAGPPAVHRYHGSMAGRVQALAAHVVQEYDGDATRIWGAAEDGADLLARLKRLPGFGDQKARIFLALLAKQLGVRPRGWQEAAGDYALPGHRSVADVLDAESLQRVREHKRAAKAAARG